LALLLATWVPVIGKKKMRIWAFHPPEGKIDNRWIKAKQSQAG